MFVLIFSLYGRTQQFDLLIVIIFFQDWFGKFEFLQFEVLPLPYPLCLYKWQKLWFGPVYSRLPVNLCITNCTNRTLKQCYVWVWVEPGIVLSSQFLTLMNMSIKLMLFPIKVWYYSDVQWLSAFISGLKTAAWNYSSDELALSSLRMLLISSDQLL